MEKVKLSVSELIEIGVHRLRSCDKYVNKNHPLDVESHIKGIQEVVDALKEKWGYIDPLTK